jgi:putative transposase
MNTPVLTDEQTLEDVIEGLLEHVSVNMQGDCTEQTLFTVLVRAASTSESIEHTCKT